MHVLGFAQMDFGVWLQQFLPGSLNYSRYCVVYHVNRFSKAVLNDGIHLLQRTRGTDRELGGSPAYGRRPRNSHGIDWRTRSPDEYYSRSSRHGNSRSPRRSRSWSPAKRRDDHHKKRNRHGQDKSNRIVSPSDHHCGEYCALIHRHGIREMGVTI
jgi:hypothetical protein